MKIRRRLTGGICAALFGAFVVLSGAPAKRLSAAVECYDQVLMWEDYDNDDEVDGTEFRAHATSPTNNPPEMYNPKEKPPILDTRVSHPNWLATWYGEEEWEGEAYHPDCNGSQEPEEEPVP